jgi:hypothetical protein
MHAVYLVGWPSGHVKILGAGANVSMCTFNVVRTQEYEKSERVLLGDFAHKVGLLKEIVFLQAPGNVFCGRSLLFGGSSGITVGGDEVASVGAKSVSVKGPGVEYTSTSSRSRSRAPCFHVLAVALESGSVVLCDLWEGKKVRTAAVEGRPVRLLVTEGMGFVVTHSVTQRPELNLVTVHTVNGERVRVGRLPGDVACWAAFKAPDGFDFVVLADRKNKLYTLEAFYCEPRPLDGYQALPGPPFLGLHAAPLQAMIVAIRKGDFVFIPMTSM